MRKARHGKVLRVQVGFMLAFYALAVCRGLIPGLCATQSALDVRFCPPPASKEAADTCCAGTTMPDGAEAALIAGSDTHPDCAFCSLITTTVRPAEAPVAMANVPVATSVCARAHDAPALAATWDPVLRRGPPVHA